MKDGKLSRRRIKSDNCRQDGWKACSRSSAGASCMQMSQIVHTFRLHLLGERPNMYTDLCWLQYCENQTAQEDVEVIVDGDSEKEDEGGYWEVRLYPRYSIFLSLGHCPGLTVSSRDFQLVHVLKKWNTVEYHLFHTSELRVRLKYSRTWSLMDTQEQKYCAKTCFTALKTSPE